jgi:SSS family solute:Na+ symporter
VVVFIWGMFWKRGNANGAFYSLISGFIIATILILLKVYQPEAGISQWHFLHTAPLIFVVCSGIYVSVSLAGPLPPVEKIKEYTWKNSIYTDETASLRALPWYKNYRILSVFLLILTFIIVWIYK